MANTHVNINPLAVDNKMWEIQMWLVQHERYTLDTAERFLSPLRWHVGTGRASVPFLQGLVTAKTFVVGRVLCRHGYGDYHKTIDALSRKFGLCEQ